MLGIEVNALLAVLLSPDCKLCLIPLVGFSSLYLADCIKSLVMIVRVKKDIKEKTLHEQITINSGDHYEGLIFVKSADYTPQFSVTMHEKGNTKKTVAFDVDLRHQEIIGDCDEL
jgi:hypothetical protein